MENYQDLPVAIVGAGPIGLAAAAHLHQRGHPFLIFEMGDQIADSVRSWEHVPMFSPWKYNLDEPSTMLLLDNGWKQPDPNHIPTGKDLVEQYLLPLSLTPEIKPFLRLGSRVTAISRKRINKMKDFGREKAPFVLHVLRKGKIEVFYAKAVIDASGTWKNQNPIGSDGLPAIGEARNRQKIFYGIPNVLGRHRPRYLSREVAVVGSGHSAINAVLELVELNQGSPTRKPIWILKKARLEDAYGGLDADELPGRGKVGQKIKDLVESGQVKVLNPLFVEEISNENHRLSIKGQSPEGKISITVDEIIAATGVRPDLEMLRELRLSIDAAVESPSLLAPLIDPNIHSCGSVKPHGAEELGHPEKDFYIVGMKSYGRAPTFLLATGYEQIRSAVAALSGDWKAAKEVRLKLPETGVCGVPRALDPNNLRKHLHLNGARASDCCNESPQPPGSSAEMYRTIMGAVRFK